MSYSSLGGNNPIRMAYNIGIYCGESIDGDAIAAEIGDVQKGSLYISTDGSLYHKCRATADGNAWYKIAAGTPETEKRLLAAVFQALTPTLVMMISKTKSVSTSLFVGKTKKVSKSNSGSITATPTKIKSVSKTKNVSSQLSPAFSKLIKLNKSVSITPSISDLEIEEPLI